ncbi:MAG: hypothetical protein IT179_20905 [Acidobacteria bacterium]|nr:hypothetical protein [Acidobacteriota bacterium]
MTFRALVPSALAVPAASALLFTIACGGSPESPAPAATPAPATAPAAPAASAPAAPGVVAVIEPSEGFSSGHISLFRWSAVEGADGYRMRLNATTDGRVIWESPVVKETETHLPNTVAMEPEGYVWQVTALKGEAVVAQSVPTRFAVTP